MQFFEYIHIDETGIAAGTVLFLLFFGERPGSSKRKFTAKIYSQRPGGFNLLAGKN